MAVVEVTGDGVAVVGVGDEVVIRLPENATTGYVWSVESIGEGLEIVGDTMVPAGSVGEVGRDAAPPGGAEPGGVPPGAAGEHLFRVRAVSPARAEVVFRLARPWESTPDPPVRRVTVTVTG